MRTRKKLSDHEVTIRTLRKSKRLGYGTTQTPGESFLSNPLNEAWWDSLDHANPVYVIPPEFVESLAKELPATEGKRARQPLLTEEQRRIETEFFNCCKAVNCDCVGEWKARPIIHSRLSGSGLFELFSTLKVRVKNPASLRWICEQDDRIKRILVMRAGQLVCDKQFISDRNALRSLWLALPSEVPFPLTRLGCNTAPVASAKDARLKQVKEFFIQVRHFLDRWELARMSTWDLPEPSGPLAEVLARVNQLGDVRISNLTPAYWPVFSDDLERVAARFDTSGGNGKGLSIRALRDDVTTFESIYRMRFVEVAVRSRYGNIRGCAARLCDAFAACGGISSVRTDEIRSRYAHTLREPCGH